MTKMTNVNDETDKSTVQLENINGNSVKSENVNKYNIIITALETLLKTNQIDNISVNDIAKEAKIGKGSIYYYFNSKNEILEALVERNYKQSIETARKLADNNSISTFTRMAMIFQACRSTTKNLYQQNVNYSKSAENSPERAFFHQKYMTYLVKELKPALTAIINQGIKVGDINFNRPEELAEIVLIILTIKIDNTIFTTSEEETAKTIQALIELLEKGTDNPIGSLNFLIS